jgi:hypothetical protein
MQQVSIPANLEGDAITTPLFERGESAALLFQPGRCAKRPPYALARSLTLHDAAREQGSEVRRSLRPISGRQATRNTFSQALGVPFDLLCFAYRHS